MCEVFENRKFGVMNPPLNELPQFLHCTQCRRIFPKTDLRTGRASIAPTGGFLCMHCLEQLRRDYQPDEYSVDNGSIVRGSSATQERGGWRIPLLSIALYLLSYPPMLYLLRGLTSAGWGLWEGMVVGATLLCLLGALTVCLVGHRRMHPSLLVGMVVLCVLNLGFVVLALMGLSPF